MKTITSVLVLFIAATHGTANAQQSARSAKLKPVPIQSGAVTLTPANTRIDFVGTHEGPKPDPRKGGFVKFSGKVVVSDNGSLESVAFDIDTLSLWSEISKLTAHLKSPDFFDVRQHPKAAFRSTSVSPSKKPGTFVVTGKFTLLGTTKEIKIPAVVSVSPRGVTLVSEFTFDRTHFGMNYGQGKVKKNVGISVVIGQRTTAGRR